MAYRELKPDDLVGKTITNVSELATNYVKLHFADGNELDLWAEDAIYTQYGNIPGILVDDPALDEG